MSVTVKKNLVGAGHDVLPTGTTVSQTAGHLLVKAGSSTIAIYAPGYWASAQVEEDTKK